jgi:hypothetical protein
MKSFHKCLYGSVAGCESALVSMRIRIQLKYVCHKTYPRRYKSLFERQGNHVYLYILVSFHVPESGYAFPLRIRIQDSQMNADPDPQHCCEVVSNES